MDFWIMGVAIVMVAAREVLGEADAAAVNAAVAEAEREVAAGDFGPAFGDVDVDDIVNLLILIPVAE